MRDKEDQTMQTTAPHTSIGSRDRVHLLAHMIAMLYLDSLESVSKQDHSPWNDASVVSKQEAT